MEAARSTETDLREQAVTGAGFFWPVFPILGWGVGVAANAWDVYGRKPIGEDEIRREADRLRGTGGT